MNILPYILLGLGLVLLWLAGKASRLGRRARRVDPPIVSPYHHPDEDPDYPGWKCQNIEAYRKDLRNEIDSFCARSEREAQEFVKPYREGIFGKNSSMVVKE